ncbi:hypothetical protein SAMN04487857_1092 [Pseudomonas sp. ok272]|nr:hypothetical protein SAMN04487857_1092 [Pseudomonas sp. ok272]SFN02156.1 hypothetical protein SAMN04487858_110217 [Pseudomonas sp. ok602]
MPPEQLSALRSILAQRSSHSLFQPIVAVPERRALGYEALSRDPSKTPSTRPSHCCKRSIIPTFKVTT